MLATEIVHGTYGGYQQCRRINERACGPCRQANSDYMAEYRRRKTGREPHKRYKPTAQHGTRSAYRKCTAGPNGRACQECRDANTAYVIMWNECGGYSDPWYDLP